MVNFCSQLRKTSAKNSDSKQAFSDEGKGVVWLSPKSPGLLYKMSERSQQAGVDGVSEGGVGVVKVL